MSPQEPIIAKPKDASGSRPAVSTPTRRQYWTTLRTMLSPQRFSLREEQFFLLLAVLIGILSGLAVVCFRLFIDFLHLKLLGSGLQPSVPRVFLAPMLAGLVVAVLVIRFFPRARGSGVNQTKAALYIYDGYIPMSTVVGKFLTSALAIGSGQSLGPEDPVAADRRGIGVGARTPAETLAREAAPHRAGGRGGWTGCGVQRSHHRRAVRHRGSHRPLDRGHPRRGRALGDLQRGGRALVSWRRAAVPRARLSS